MKVKSGRYLDLAGVISAVKGVLLDIFQVNPGKSPSIRTESSQFAEETNLKIG